MKKAQMEIMGLVMIVILITILLLFTLVFNVANKEEESTQTQFTNKQLRERIGSTILETHSTCGQKLREIAENCAYNKEITCSGQKSCEYLNQTLTQITNETMGKSGMNYTITLQEIDKPPILTINHTGCYKENPKGIEITNTLIKTKYEHLILQIYVCK